ncbi:NACHT domain-containing protein [Sphingomonas soli]|uniref:NACHT domain-containing protein n=1 Tax=Sphingomonas soli TaxID=266127 RepID=UPI000A02D85D|nr:NACHT domain-containing protein [Sphingomonas soli]
MPLRINATSIAGIVDDKLPRNDFSVDIHRLVDVLRNIIKIDPSTSALEFQRRMSGEIAVGISAAERLLDDSSGSAIHVSAINSLERFAILHYVSVQRAFLKGLEEAVVAIKFDPEVRDAPIRPEKARLPHQDLNRVAEHCLSLDVPYTLTINPVSQLGDYYLEQYRSVATMLGHILTGWKGPREFSPSTEVAITEYKNWLTSGLLAVRSVTSYLNYEQQSAPRTVVNDDVHGISVALRDWLRANTEMSQRKKDMWQTYRRTLSELPDGKDTMFAENFGVRKVFVQPLASYQVAGVKQKSEPPIITDVAGLVGTLISDRTEGDDLILLAGGPGSGKSTLCRILASELAANDNVHPVFLRLRRLQESGDIRGFIESQLQALGLIDKVADLASVPNLVLILDGFDELVMASRAKLREFFNALKEDLSTGPLRHAKAIVSGRDTLFPNGNGLPMGAHLISLQPFDRARIAAWSKKWRDQHELDTVQNFFPETLVAEQGGRGHNSSPLEHLVSWPLTLHLVARAHTSGSIDLDPKKANQVEKAVLYRSIVADTALRQDDQTGGRNRLSPDQMRRFVRAIAWEMYSTGREALDVTEGLPILRSILPEATESDLSELADVTIVNQPELTKGEETGFEFVHKSFSEYFAAETIATRIEEACFKVTEWGGTEKSWRMSVKEATSALSALFSMRLLTAEVQEMLEPMLDSFQAFLSNINKAGDFDPDEMPGSLLAKLERMEELLHAFSAGGLLGEVSGSPQQRRSTTSDLESFANYASGLLFVAVALTRRLEVHAAPIARPVRLASATLLRTLHIVLAGDVVIDWAYARRGLSRLDVRRDDKEGTEIGYPPIAPILLSDVRGLSTHLEEALLALDSQVTALELENIILTAMIGLNGAHANPSIGFRHMRYDHRVRYGNGPMDYLERVVTLRDRDRYDMAHRMERNLYEMVDRFRGNYGGSMPPSSAVGDAIGYLREASLDARHRGMHRGELYDLAERILRSLIGVEPPRPRRPKKSKPAASQ